MKHFKVDQQTKSVLFSSQFLTRAHVDDGIDQVVKTFEEYYPGEKMFFSIKVGRYDDGVKPMKQHLIETRPKIIEKTVVRVDHLIRRPSGIKASEIKTTIKNGIKRSLWNIKEKLMENNEIYEKEFEINYEKPTITGIIDHNIYTILDIEDSINEQMNDEQRALQEEVHSLKRIKIKAKEQQESLKKLLERLTLENEVLKNKIRRDISIKRDENQRKESMTQPYFNRDQSYSSIDTGASTEIIIESFTQNVTEVANRRGRVREMIKEFKRNISRMCKKIEEFPDVIKIEDELSTNNN